MQDSTVDGGRVLGLRVYGGRCARRICTHVDVSICVYNIYIHTCIHLFSGEELRALRLCPSQSCCWAFWGGGGIIWSYLGLMRWLAIQDRLR